MGSIIDRRSYAHQLEARLKIRASTVRDWLFDFVLGQGAEARRLRALPVLLKEPERPSDNHLGGQTCLATKASHRRYYCED